MKIENVIVLNAILNLALSVRRALDFHARHFGKQAVQKYLATGGTQTAPEGAEPEAVKAFKKDHKPSLDVASALAKSANVTLSSFCEELENVRLAHIAAVKAEDEVKAAMKGAAKVKPASNGDNTPARIADIKDGNATPAKATA
jgi:hypothetical protein